MAKLAAAGFLAAGLTACGLKDDLFLPEDQSETEQGELAENDEDNGTDS